MNRPVSYESCVFALGIICTNLVQDQARFIDHFVGAVLIYIPYGTILVLFGFTLFEPLFYNLNVMLKPNYTTTIIVPYWMYSGLHF